jgi:hypothetical protein
MHTDSIIIGSITYALKAKNALADAGIRARVKKFPPSELRGCNYGLELPAGMLLTVAAVLRPLHIQYQVL